MPEEIENKRTDSTPLPADPNIGNRVSPAAKSVSTDKWAVRRAELKRQKRRAHRRRINASNTPG